MEIFLTNLKTKENIAEETESKPSNPKLNQQEKFWQVEISTH